MGAKPRSCGRTVRLDGIALVKEVFLVKFLEQKPNRLDVLVVIGYIRLVQIDPIPHQPGQFFPFAGVLQDIFTAMPVEFFDRNALSNIIPADAQFLFNLQFHGEAVGIPTAFALDAIPLHGPVPS